jgi:cyclic pyranopterin phosphate synthase
MTEQQLTHVDAEGRTRMVDVSDKAVTQRTATAAGRVLCSAGALHAIEVHAGAKGNVIETARLAGIMGAKRTPELIPLCHPLPLRHVDLDITLEHEPPAVLIEATARVEAATGVEMEALTAVAVAGLTVIDMIKAVDRWAVISDVRLLRKEGGRSGTVVRPAGPQPGAS